MKTTCTDCGNTFWTHDYDGGDYGSGDTIGCPNCGSYRTQVSPVHNEMELRDMPGAGPGEADTGGNPLKEGILADGGWNNRMKRDESFASVQAVHLAFNDDDEWDDEEDANPYDPSQFQLQERFIVGPNGQVYRPSSGLLESKGPEHTFHEDIANEHGIPNFTQGHSLGEVWNHGLIKFPQHQNGMDHGQMTQLLSSYYPNHTVDPTLAATSNSERWGIPNTPAYEHLDPNYQNKFQQQQESEDQRGRPYGYYDNPYFNRGGSVMDGRNVIYLPWTRETSSVDADFEVEQIIPPGHHTVEVSQEGEKNPIILQHDNPDVLEAAKERMAMTHTAFLPLLLPLLGEAAEGLGASELGGAAASRVPAGVASGLIQGAMRNGGPDDQSGAGNTGPQPVNPNALSSVHNSLLSAQAAFDHPSSKPFNDDTDDPEKVDPHEHNDGDNSSLEDFDINGGGGTDDPHGIDLNSDIGKLFTDALPSLLHYHGSPESGENDPKIQALMAVIPQDLLSREPEEGDLAKIEQAKKSLGDKTANEFGGIVNTPNPATGAPTVNPSSQGFCPQCGARLQPGQTTCPQCGAGQQASQSPALVQPLGNPAPLTGPGQGMPVQASGQGAQNIQQVQAVAQYLISQGREDEIKNLVLDPDQYADLLFQIQQKGITPPNPDQDAGAPPDISMQGPGGAPPSTPPGGGAPMPPPTSSLRQAAPMDDPMGSSPMQAEPVGPDTPANNQSPWADQTGQPLQVGGTYEMYSSNYDVPDVVKIEAVKPNSIEYELTGEYGLSHRTEVTKQEADMEALSFVPQDTGVENNDDLGDHGDARVPAAPGEVNDLSRPHTDTHNFGLQASKMAADNITPPCPRCGSHTTSLEGTQGKCANCGKEWKLDTEEVPAATTTAKSAADWGSFAPGKGVPFDQHDEQSAQNQQAQLDPRNQNSEWAEFCPNCDSQNTTRTGPMHRHCLDCGNTFTPFNESDDQVRETYDPSQVGYPVAGPDSPPGMTVGDLGMRNQGKTAGAKFSPMEQREFIDEVGQARNRDKLDLANTHYEQSSFTTVDDSFLW